MHGAAIETYTGTSLDEDLPASFWTSLHHGAGFYQSRPWLKFTEWSAGKAVTYAWVTMGGRALGLLPVYPAPDAPGSGYTLAELSGDDATDIPAGVCGNRRGYRNEMLITTLSPASGTGRAVLARLAGAALQACTDMGCPTVVFPYVSREYAGVLCQVLPHAIPLLSRLDAHIDVRGRSFDEYVRELGSQKAWKVRKEIRRFAQAGYRTGVERLGDCWHEAGPLVANVQQRYGHNDTAESCRRGLRAQAELLSDHDLVFTARNCGKLVAAAVYYKWNDTLVSRCVGFDYASLAGAGEYFNLNIYQPMNYACEHGLERIMLGTGTESAKRQRGAQLTGLWTVAAGPELAIRLHDWRARNAAALERLKLAAQITDADLPDEWCGDNDRQ
jgi:uncharacterized protein